MRYRLVGVPLYYIPDRLELVKVGADEGGVDAASFAVSAWSLARFQPTGTVRMGQEASFLAQLAAGWGEFRARS